MAAALETPLPPTGYYAAVYVCVSVLVSMLLVLLVYVLCSKKYRLNWFEQTVLQTAQEKEQLVESSLRPDSPTDVAGLAGPASLNTDGTESSSSSLERRPSPPAGGPEFWVPGSLQRQASVCQSDVPDFSGDETSVPGTPNTPLGVQVSPFSLQQMVVTGEKYVQPSTSVRPKLTSMHSKLDHTKINAAMYQKPLVRTPSLPEDMRGSIQFSLAFDSQFGLLAVHLLQARDLVARDFSGTADPYAKIRVLPDKKNFRQSRIQKKTLNPVFEEDFVFEVPLAEVSKRTVEVLVYDFDQYSRHQCMGSVQLPLEHVDLSEKVTVWKGISPCDEKDERAELGDLMFSLGYLPSAERLTVVVLKAMSVRPVDEVKIMSNPYVKVSLVVGGRRLKKKKTTTQKGTVNPVFNEALTFSVTKEQLRCSTLELTVLHDNLLGQNETLGRVMIGPNSKGEEGEHFRAMTASRTAVARWHPLVEPD